VLDLPKPRASLDTPVPSDHRYPNFSPEYSEPRTNLSTTSFILWGWTSGSKSKPFSRASLPPRRAMASAGNGFLSRPQRVFIQTILFTEAAVVMGDSFRGGEPG
jgi:hypothetical protein